MNGFSIFGIVALAALPVLGLLLRRSRSPWTPERQLEHLRIQVQQDSQWLAHNPIAKVLTIRYLNMLADDWYSRPVVGISHFRELIGCGPSHVRERNRPEAAFRNFLATVEPLRTGQLEDAIEYLRGEIAARHSREGAAP